MLAAAILALASGRGPVWAAGQADSAGAAPKPLAPGAATEAQAQPYWQMFGTYCEKCHNTDDWAGGVAFGTMLPQDIPSDAKIWEEAVTKLSGRMMPPPGQKQPSQATIDAFLKWIEGHLDAAAAVHPDPGYVILHRLNRTEYARSVEQMLDVKFDVSSFLPKDTKSDDFDNIANVLTVSPTFLDQYISTARTVAELAIGDPHPAKAIAIYHPAKEDQAFHIEGLPLGTRGGMVVTHYFPTDGDYDFDLDVFSGVGYIIGLDQPQSVVLTIDDQKVFERSLGGEQDLKEADQHPNEAAKDLKARFQHIRVHVPAGPHQIGVAFIARTFAESDEWLFPFNVRGGEDRIPRIGGLQITGPYDPSGITQTPSRKQIFICRPVGASDELPCARRILARIAREAYRRPLTDADLVAPLRFYAQARQGKSFDAGIESGIVAILCSPKFLYRAEFTPPNLKVGGIYRVSDLDLASRLSFFLWGEGPDDGLLDAATADKLHEPRVLEAEVRRMLADRRAESLVTDFAFQWLEVDSMDKIEPDPVAYPEFDEDLRSAYREEMRLFLGSILLEDQDVRELMTANWTYVNERLALAYGIANVQGAQFRRVVLPDSSRDGLLGKGAILMGTSYANRTAPVLRGAWVLDVITGTPPHAPPPAIPALKENIPGAEQLTIRERMVMHRRQPSCNACHGIMDPMGLSLENFNAMGEWQSKDRDAGLPIDAEGQIADGTRVRGPDDLRKALMRNPDQFVETLTAKLMTFALGRTLDYHDMPTVRAIVRNAARDHYRFSSIVLGIVESPQFEMQRIPGGGHGNPPNLMTTQAANLN
jgi:Protein of unknown function (DUF1592)/Protein of unknown function (DUF1588)/Protein of unknown function (DUF1585)/Protein of unknown function (DUF1595)/Protein of unknown function (DUF1587)